MKKIAYVLVAGIFAPALFIPAVSGEEPKKKNWKDVAEVSVVSVNGNTKSNTYSAKNTYNYDWTRSGLEITGSALGANSEGDTTAEKYSAGEKFTFNLTEKNYAYERVIWDKDRFSGIQSRIDSSVGLGREVIATAKNNLKFELGAGYVNEDRTRGPVNDFTSGRAYGKYVRTLSETANFSQDAEYLHNFDDPEGFRVNTESALTASVSTHMALKISYVWHHVQTPPIGFGRNDTTTTAALVFNY